jgi:hypothetical protein
VPRQGQFQLCLIDAFAVVANTNQLLSARDNIDLYRLRTGIETVLHEFLDHGCGALHDLAGGDLVDQVTGELLDGHAADRQ